MTVFLHSLSGVIVILVMIVLAWALTRKGWFNDDYAKVTARLVTQVALPAYMIVTISGQFHKQELLSLLPDLRFPLISMFILFALSFPLARVFRVQPQHHGLWRSMFFNSNTVFIGLPINMALFGNRSLPEVLVYYMANTFLFWTLGVYLIKRDGLGGDAHFSLWGALKKLFSPPLLGFIIGVILVLLEWHLPQWLMSDLNYVGGLTIPLSMFFIGMTLGHFHLAQLRFTWDMVGILAGRFIFAPALMFALLWPVQAPLLLKQVFVLQSAMPVMTNAPVVAKLYGADADYAALMVTMSTLLSMLVIPLLMVIVQAMH
ncbi:AEC family transporter [Schleiferilactobacillus harbinensis]|jgi:auxin efflux carrier (AEC)|uniref:AEC family transporter n=1 Tax=Schleiferilactobacillus harbinensis TaxID=304207 RepID=UPI00242D44CD|nr:AEC family transporter [Schleiferilactobacillus harbinensis]MCI1850350.1 AEC family transporter [Schleiferilactobacillus harbinensis]